MLKVLINKLINKSAGKIYDERRLLEKFCPADSISQAMINTVISLEDVNFYRHKGIDIIKIIQALFRNILYHKNLGASTITQQLAKNLYLTPEKTIKRKLKEMLLAGYIERELTKDKILELYLNIIYFGHGAYGIFDAAEVYFHCKPSQLNLSQSAGLCAMMQAPSRFNPYADAGLFIKRAKLAYSVLLKHGDIQKSDLPKLVSETEKYLQAINIQPQEESTDIAAINRGKTDNKMRRLSYKSADGDRYQFHHLFFHSLILEPELCFGEKAGKDGDFEAWFVTVGEFKKILQTVYTRGYVLVDTRKLLFGSVELPFGKTPLVLSFDDMNYYDYMKGHGFVSRVILDENGEISFEKDGKNGTKQIKYGDSITVLEQFIAEHPDFSFEGARGIIGLTGYEGMLGYRDLSNPALPEIVKKLKSMGWDFACHSWGHHKKIYNNENPDAEKGIIDMEKWLSGVGRVLEKTDMFITPFGVEIRKNPKLLSFLKSRGFRYFFSVADRRAVYTDGDSFYIERTNIDGMMMQYRAYDFEVYYGDLSAIRDKRRTKKYSAPAMDAATLVSHAYVCMRMPTHYCWDGMGEIMTEQFFEEKGKMYPEVYEKYDIHKGPGSLMNGETRAFDCSGLIKCFLMGGLSHFVYDASLDMNSGVMFERAKVKGDIADLPEKPGICLYMQGHVGIYVGNGRVIESTSNPKFGNGVVMTRLSDRCWTNWFQSVGIDYGDKS